MKPTIVYLHGLNCTSTIFTFMRSQFPAHEAVLIDYDSQQSVEDSYNYILSKVPRKKPFSVIGHSLGGILGYLLASRGHLSKLQHLVSISTPFGGSRAAGILKWLYPGFRVLKDLSPSSKILDEIAEYTPGVPFLSFVSMLGHLPFISAEANDGVVTVASQLATHPDIRFELNANHIEIMQHPVTIDECKKFLFK